MCPNFTQVETSEDWPVKPGLILIKVIKSMSFKKGFTSLISSSKSRTISTNEKLNNLPWQII